MKNDMKKLPRVLIVDDEMPVRELLAEVLGETYECDTADSAETALKMIAGGDYGVVITDIDMPGLTGIEMVPMIHEISPDMAILMISGNISMDYAIQAVRLGAFDYITKPFELEFVEVSVNRAAEHHNLLVQKRQYEAGLETLVKQRTDQLHFVTYHDTVTGLPNRGLFEDRLARAVISATELAVLHVSLDGFEKVRDSLGHAAADQVLCLAADRLSSLLDERSTISRLQGAEFAILADGNFSPDRLAALAERINKEVKRPILCNGHEVFLTTSVGIAIHPQDGATAEELMNNAAVAVSTSRGSGSYQFYAEGMNARTLRKLQLEGALRRALEQEEFELHYQPKVNVGSGKVVGMEALLRWNSPEHGAVSPVEFIPIAEESGLVEELGEWVLKTACEDTQRWRNMGFDLEVAVNVSARQLMRPNLAERFTAIVKATGLQPAHLNLEVTETAVMEDAAAAVERLNKLRETGVRISLDDFGTGYSSLAYLKRLPIDTLKIDKSFIQDLRASSDDAVLAMAMVNLGHNLRLKIVAEGVETAEQLQFLNFVGCDEYQGYIFSKPLSGGDFEKLLMIEFSEVQKSRSKNERPSILPHIRPKALAA